MPCLDSRAPGSSFVLSVTWIDDQPETEHEHQMDSQATAQAFVQRHLNWLRRWDLTNETGQVVFSTDDWTGWITQQSCS